MSVKYKRDIDMKFDVPWLFPPECVAYYLTPIYQFFRRS